jgi:hypothetical protein
MFPAGAANRTNFNNYANGTLFNRIEMLTGYTLAGNRITLGNGLLAFSLTNLTLGSNPTLIHEPFTSTNRLYRGGWVP